MNQILVLSAGSLQSSKGAASLYDQLCSSLYTSVLKWKFLLRLLVLTDWKLQSGVGVGWCVPDQSADFHSKIKKGIYNIIFSQVQRGYQNSPRVKVERRFHEKDFY